MKTLEQIDYLKKQLGIRDNQVLEEVINSYTNAQASLENQLVKQQQRIDKTIEYIKTYIEIDEETGTYTMPYTFDAHNLYKILKKLKGEDNESK